MGSAAPRGLADPIPAPAPEPGATVIEKRTAVGAGPDSLREAVLTALGDAGHRMLVSVLETGDWSLDSNELVIQVAASRAVVDMSLGTDARRLAVAAASGAAGRALKLRVVPGGAAEAAAARSTSASKGGERARAEGDPIVRRLQEKFGAEIRTIIDQRDKK
jgi:DNA polymerase-3 subunit gamma/tau